MVINNTHSNSYTSMFTKISLQTVSQVLMKFKHKA